MPLVRNFWIIAIVIVALASSAVTFFLVRGTGHSDTRQADNLGSTYERVLKTHTLRAGYISYIPNSIVDPNTHEITGIFPDLLRQIGQVTGLKIEFTEEVGYANLIEGLETGRYDIIGGLWVNSERAKMATISAPVYFSGMSIWARPDETSFSSENNWASINSKNIRIGAIDGSTIMHIIQTNYPQATLVSYPNLTSESQLFLDLVDKKVDLFFAETSQGLIFLKNNPGEIINISGDHPFRMYGNSFLMHRGEFQMKTMIDAAIAELQGSGVVDTLIDKYEAAPNAYYRVAPPYVSNSSSH